MYFINELFSDFQISPPNPQKQVMSAQLERTIPRPPLPQHAAHAHREHIKTLPAVNRAKIAPQDGTKQTTPKLFVFHASLAILKIKQDKHLAHRVSLAHSCHPRLPKLRHA